MLRIRSKEVNEIKHNLKDTIAVYHLSHLVWQNALSCFGKGYWDDTAPWSDTDGWKQ